MAERDASGRFRRVPAARRTAAYNKRLRSQLTTARKEKGPQRAKLTRAELRGHAPQKVKVAPVGESHWFKRPGQVSKFKGEATYWYAAFEVHLASGEDGVRTATVAVNESYLYVRHNADMLEQRGRHILEDGADDYLDPYTVGRFLGFTATAAGLRKSRK